MKKLSILILLIFQLTFLSAQEVVGEWYGNLDIDGVSLQIIFNISKTNRSYSASISVPLQGAERIPMTSAAYVGKHLSLNLENPPINYEGDFDGTEIKGKFKQGGRALALNLTQDKTAKKEMRKPQEPVAPYGYYEEEVKFYNSKAKINLTGTLTLPTKEGKHPVVILVSGSGPQNRNQEIMGHKPFWVLADYLTKKGIGVLRYDDRGVGGSQGNFNSATSYDFSEDAEAALDYVKKRKEVNPERIIIAGHSEGGIIAPMVAARREEVFALILLAAPSVRGDKLLLTQQEMLGRAGGMPEEDLKKTMGINQEIFEMVLKHQDSTELKLKLANYLNSVYDKLKEEERPQGISKNDFIKIQVHQIASPWMKFYLNYDPAEALKKIRCAVLAINGELDLQVSSKQNLNEIDRVLKAQGNTQVKIISYPGLNHLFQPSILGTPDEYASNEITFSSEVMSEIEKWLKGLK